MTSGPGEPADETGTDGSPTPDGPDIEALAGALDVVEDFLLGAEPSLTRVDVAEQAGMPLGLAMELWRLMGFANLDDTTPAFTQNDVEALRMAGELRDLGILDEDSQAALVRTWGRSFARLAEWQTTLLASVAVDGPDPENRLATLAVEVMPRVEALQSYVWRRHLASSASRLLEAGSRSGVETEMCVGFVDIVGYTRQSKELDDAALVAWIEGFEQESANVLGDLGGRIIKTIGDEVLFVTDDAPSAAEAALTLVERGLDEADPFPEVRAGLAHGMVLSRLGDVLGPTVNIAARLTSHARGGTVLCDEGAWPHLERDDRFTGKRLRRVSVKGYDRLPAWVVRRAAT